MVYDMHGRELWRVAMPNYDVLRAGSAFSPTLSADGTIYVGWRNNVPGIKGITAFDMQGKLKYTGACDSSNGSNLFLITLDSQGRPYWMTSESNQQIVFGCNIDGTKRWGRGTGQTGSTGRNGFGVAIDSHDVVYATLNDGLHALRSEDGTDYWISPIGGGPSYANIAVSPDEKYVAAMAGNLFMVDASSGQRLWFWGLGTGNGTFTFGKDNRIYISADTSTITGLNPIRDPKDVTTESAGKVCALDVPTGNKIWCFRTGGHLESNDMVVDSNNAVYFVDGVDRSIFAVDTNGNLQFRYRDYLQNGFGIPVMSDDGKLFVANRYFEGFRPWTLTPTAVKKPQVSGTGVYFTVKSSMLRRDLQDGVTADNQVQVRLDGGKLIPLKYLHQDGDDSVWEGVYSVSTGTDLSKVQLKGQVEAIANQTTSALITHFSSVPGGFNNTGMVQSFDLGTADKLSGTAAQSTAAPTDDFTRAYQATVGWIRDTSLTVWAYLKSAYASVADFVMR